jgi:hypothetical protein
VKNRRIASALFRSSHLGPLSPIPIEITGTYPRTTASGCRTPPSILPTGVLGEPDKAQKFASLRVGLHLFGLRGGCQVLDFLEVRTGSRVA